MVESKFKPDMQIADEGHDEDLAEKRLKFSAEDVKYLAYSHLALRYVSGKTNLDAHSEGPVKGDAHPICAMHLLLTAEEKEGSRKPAHGYIDMVEKYADRIAQRLDTKLDEILSWAHVEPEGKVKPESYFLLVSGMRGLERFSLTRVHIPSL